jgi:hypothetical protein
MLRLYTNERFLDEDQPLKIALIDITDEGQERLGPTPCKVPSDTKVLGTGVPEPLVGGPDCNPSVDAAAKNPSPEIDAKLELWADDSLVDIKVVPLSRRPTRLSQYQPTLAFEIPGKSLRAGIYEIRATLDGPASRQSLLWVEGELFS